MKLLASLLATASLTEATVYHLQVYAPGTNIHKQIVHAGGLGLWLGLEEASTYCPQVVEDMGSCPPEMGTLVNSGLSAMAVMVPGGEAIYVAPNGQIKYTQAHSSWMEPGSFLGGFYETTAPRGRGGRSRGCGRGRGGGKGKGRDKVVDVMQWETPGHNCVGGLFACGEDAVSDWFMPEASHRLMAGTPELVNDGCVELGGLVLIAEDEDVHYGTWQYT